MIPPLWESQYLLERNQRLVVTPVTRHTRDKYELYSQQLELGLRHVYLACETSRSEHFQVRSGNIPKTTERAGKESNTDSSVARFYSFMGAMGALTVDIINRIKRLMPLATSQQQAKKKTRETENSCCPPHPARWKAAPQRWPVSSTAAKQRLLRIAQLRNEVACCFQF